MATRQRKELHCSNVPVKKTTAPAIPAQGIINVQNKTSSRGKIYLQTGQEGIFLHQHYIISSKKRLITFK